MINYKTLPDQSVLFKTVSFSKVIASVVVNEI